MSNLLRHVGGIAYMYASWQCWNSWKMMDLHCLVGLISLITAAWWKPIIKVNHLLVHLGLSLPSAAPSWLTVRYSDSLAFEGLEAETTGRRLHSWVFSSLSWKRQFRYIRLVRLTWKHLKMFTPGGGGELLRSIFRCHSLERSMRDGKAAV